MPPGKRTAPVTTPGPPRVAVYDSLTVAPGPVNLAALRRLVELHDRGYLTRREVERAFGAPYDRLAAAARIAYWRAA
jgi:hypothetical protein